MSESKTNVLPSLFPSPSHYNSSSSSSFRSCLPIPFWMTKNYVKKDKEVCGAGEHHEFHQQEQKNIYETLQLRRKEDSQVVSHHNQSGKQPVIERKCFLK